MVLGHETGRTTMDREKSENYISRKTVTIIALFTFMAFALGCSEFVVIGIEPELAEHFDVSHREAGKLVSWFAFAYAVATPVLAVCTGRVKRFTLMVIYLAVFVAANTLAMLAPTFGVMLVARVLMGSVCGTTIAVAITVVPELIPEKYVSIGASIIYGAYSVAMVVSTALARYIAGYFNWHWTITGTMVISLLASVAVIAVMPRHGETDEPAGMMEQIVFLKNPKVISGIFVYAFGVGGCYVVYAYISPYLENTVGLVPSQTSLVLIVFGGLTFVSNLLAGVVDMKWGMKSLIPAYAVGTVVLTAMSLCTGSTTASIGLVFAMGIVIYIVSIPCLTMFMRESREKCPKALTLAASLDPTAFNIGIAFGTALGGQVIVRAGLPFLGYAGGVLCLMAVIMVVVNIKLK